MVRLQTSILALVIVAAAFTGAAVADSPSLEDSVNSIGATDGYASAEDSDEDESDEEDSDGEDSDGEDSDAENGTEDPAPAELVITDVETNTPITVGETIRVTVTVENTGEEAGTGDVWFDLGEYRKDDTSVSIDPGETTSVSLSYVSKSGDAQDWSMTAGTPHDTSTRTITIEERDDDGEDEEDDESSSGGSSSGSSGFSGSATFDIQSFNATDSATVGDVVQLNATVENTGTVGEEKLVWFTADGSTVNETIVDLDRGAEQTVTYAYNTSELENGTHELAAETPDGTATQELVLEPKRSDLRVDSIDADSTVDAGEHLEVSVDLHNAGNATANTSVTLLLGEHRTDEVPVAVAPNESTTVQLTYRTNTHLTGDLDFAIDAGDIQEPFSVTVAESTPEPTTTPEQIDEDANSSNSTPTEEAATTPEDAAGTNETVPGFGVVPLLSALLIAFVSVVARHRQD